jgi:iron-sulfur cluster insertion protein
LTAPNATEVAESPTAALDPARGLPHIGRMATVSADIGTHDNPGSPGAPTLVFTDAAAAKVGELISEEANPNLKLRVFVQGGGCSGFQYGFTFDENVEEGDTQVGNRGVTLLIDPMSIQYLAGAEIDYREDIEGAQFVIRNPNAATTCGCGSSFST